MKQQSNHSRVGFEIKIISLLFFLCFGLISCAHIPKEYQAHMDLQLGMSKQQVTTVMGPPNEYEKYQRPNTVIVEYLIYKYFVAYEDKTPICFIDNKLVGWGSTYYLDHVSTDDKRLR